MTNDTRFQQLQRWLADCFKGQHYELVALAGDASFRRYLHLTTVNDTFVVMDAPPPNEDTHPFIRVAEKLSSIGLNAPHILASDTERGFLLLSCLGCDDYLSKLNETTADSLYHDAIDALITLQKNYPVDDLPRFDHAHIQTELSLFSDWYLQRHLGIDIGNRLDGVYQALIDNALNQPQVAIHRDYHSRNLMICEQQNPGILDFQDMMLGPVSYDLVSLLKDCYIAHPTARVTAWVDYYLQQSGLAFPQFYQAFELMGVQRHLKAVGIFCRLNYRDNKPQYLTHIPLCLKYLANASDNFAMLKPLSGLLRDIG